MTKKSVVEDNKKTTTKSDSDMSDIFDIDMTEVMMMMFMIIMMSTMMSSMINNAVAQGIYGANTYNGVYGSQVFGTQALSASGAVRQSFVGRIRSIILNCTPSLQVLNVDTPEPWVYVLLRNTGTRDVRVGINGSSDMFNVRANTEFFVDRFNALERITSIYYVCASGQYTTLAVKGEY